MTTSSTSFYKPIYEEPYYIGPKKPKKTACELVGIPMRFAGYTFKTVEELGIPTSLKPALKASKAYADKLKEHVDRGEGIIFRGGVGTMKTTFAVAIMREAMKQGLSVYFVSLVNLMDDFFSLDEEERAKLQQKLSTVQLLVLDDLGQEHGKEDSWIKTKIRAIVNERYNAKKATIYTTNLLRGDITKAGYMASMLDRISHCCYIVNCQGESQRKPLRFLEEEIHDNLQHNEAN